MMLLINSLVTIGFLIVTSDLIKLYQGEDSVDHLNSHFSINCDFVSCPVIEICLEPQQEIVQGIRIGGCCPGCVYISGVNETCGTYETRCKHGLTCDQELGHCVRGEATSKCIRKQERLKSLNGKKFCSNRGGNLVSTGFQLDTSQHEPDCNQVTGQYKAKQCKSANCNCVNPDSGEKIFGKSQSTYQSNMTCSCSVSLTQLTKMSSINQLDYQSNIHQHCSDNGNFASLQCYHQLCYCSDPLTGKPKSPMVLKDAISILDCYYDTYQRQVEVNCDEKVEYTDDDGNKRLRDLCYCIDHDSGQKWRMRKADLKVCFDFIESQNLIGADYSKPCERKLQPLANLTQFFQRKGIDVIGLSSVQCDLDGNYYYRQCTDTECSCVNTNGDGTGNYRIDRYGNDDRNMRCDCAIQEYEITTLGKPYDKLLCDLYGNFKANQCFEAGLRCFCVDSNGNRISDVISSNLIPSGLSISEICSTMRTILEIDQDDDDQLIWQNYNYQAC